MSTSSSVAAARRVSALYQTENVATRCQPEAQQLIDYECEPSAHFSPNNGDIVSTDRLGWAERRVHCAADEDSRTRTTLKGIY